MAPFGSFEAICVIAQFPPSFIASDSLSYKSERFAFSGNPRPPLRDVKPHLAISRKMPIFVGGMARQCTDMDEALRLINQRLRKLKKSDSEKSEEIGRLNRIIGQKDVEIHRLKMELAGAKARIKELEGQLGGEGGSSGKPEKNSSNSSIPPSQESIAARELRRTKSLRKPSGRPSGGQPGHKGCTLQTVATPDRVVKYEPAYCKCCGRLLDGIGCRKIRKTQVMDIRFVMETTEEQYYEKVCECGCVNRSNLFACKARTAMRPTAASSTVKTSVRS